MPTPSSSSAPTDRKSTRLNSSHTVIYTLSLHDALPISKLRGVALRQSYTRVGKFALIQHQRYAHAKQFKRANRSEEHTSELQSHRDLHSFPTRRSSDLEAARGGFASVLYAGRQVRPDPAPALCPRQAVQARQPDAEEAADLRSEEHTSELQSHSDL